MIISDDADSIIPYQIWIVATRTIKEGEEIFLDYGESYDASSFSSNSASEEGEEKKRRRKCVNCESNVAKFRVETSRSLVFCGLQCYRRYMLSK
jgi:hypothetical protein